MDLQDSLMQSKLFSLILIFNTASFTWSVILQSLFSTKTLRLLPWLEGSLFCYQYWNRTWSFGRIRQEVEWQISHDSGFMGTQPEWPYRILNYPRDIRRAIYTTNAIESLNFSLRKVTRNKSSFPDDDSIYKIMYLAIKNASTRWTMPIKDWGLAVNQFAILFDGRVPVYN